METTDSRLVSHTLPTSHSLSSGKILTSFPVTAESSRMSADRGNPYGNLKALYRPPILSDPHPLYVGQKDERPKLCVLCNSHYHEDFVIHEVKCVLRQKCPECVGYYADGVFTHMDRCQRVTRCHHCNTRTDVDIPLHPYTCKTVKKCNTCNIRMDWVFDIYHAPNCPVVRQTHASTFVGVEMFDVDKQHESVIMTPVSQQSKSVSPVMVESDENDNDD